MVKSKQYIQSVSSSLLGVRIQQCHGDNGDKASQYTVSLLHPTMLNLLPGNNFPTLNVLINTIALHHN